jgi:hypothetical protein
MLMTYSKATFRKIVLLASLIVASAAAALPALLPRGLPCGESCGGFTGLLLFSFCLGAAWVPLAWAAIALSRGGRRWLVLLAAPVALFWPLSVAFLFLWAALFGAPGGFF